MRQPSLNRDIEWAWKELVEDVSNAVGFGGVFNKIRELVDAELD
jgi:hypothetical protein